MKTNSVKETSELRKLEFLTRLLERAFPRELAENICFSQSKILITKRRSTKQSKNIQKCFAFHRDFQPSYA